MHRALIADERLDPDILARFVPGDPIGPALHCMQSLINEHLHHRASPRLLWEQSRDRLGLYIVPEGLIGALWLQFARAVERDAKFRQCAECTTWFELAPGRGRTDKQYCSTACRTKAYRKRQAEAVAAAWRGALARGHRPRARQRSRHRARLDRAQGSVRTVYPKSGSS